MRTFAYTVLFVLIVLSAAFAAEKPSAAVSAKEVQSSLTVQESPSDDPLGRSTPQGTVMGFMRAVNRQDYDRAIEYLDTKQPPKRAEQLAVELQFIIDRGLSYNLNNLSHEPEGESGDGLRPNRERVGVVKTTSETLEIQLERVQRNSDPPIWLFSSDTLRRVPRVFEQLDAPFLDRYLPGTLAQKRILYYPLSTWINFFVVLPLLLVLSRLVSRGIIFALRPLIRRLSTKDDGKPVERVKNPFNLFVLAVSFYAYAPLFPSALGRLFWTQMAITLTVVSLSWLSLRLIDVLVERTARGYRITEASGRIAIARLGGQFCKGLVVIAGAAVILYNAGVNLTAVFTGLGVGGIAIAFAAQKTLENLFGGIMIASDQPVRVGDFCRAGDYSGTVESIGLRSTRIRTVDRTVVSVPNGQLSVMSLENFAVRDKIKLNHTIGLRSETSADQLRYVLGEVRRMLLEHEKVESLSARVRLVALKSSAFELELFAYVMATSWEVFLQIQEELLLRVIEIVEASGTTFAAPASAPFVMEGGSDVSKGRKGEKSAVRKQRAQGQLTLPEPSK